MAAALSWKQTIACIFAASHFYRVLTILAFFLGSSACKESIKVAGIARSTSQIKMATPLREELRARSSLPRRSSKFQPSRIDQAIFLNLKIPLARLPDVSKVVNQNRRPRKLFVFLLLLLSVSLALFWVRQRLPNLHKHECIFLG